MLIKGKKNLSSGNKASVKSYFCKKTFTPYWNI